MLLTGDNASLRYLFAPVQTVTYLSRRLPAVLHAAEMLLLVDRSIAVSKAAMPNASKDLQDLVSGLPEDRQELAFPGSCEYPRM